MKTIQTKHIAVLLVLLAVMTLSSCFDDDDATVYATNADFGIVQSDYLGRLVSFTTDNNVYRVFNDPVTGTGAKADTTYRALIYYTADNDNATYVDYYYITEIPVFAPIEVANTDSLPTDPISSVAENWVSENGSYINLLVSLYPPYSQDDVHKVDFVKSKDEDGTTLLTMYHKNPDNYYPSYTVSEYMSIPIKGYFTSGEKVKMVVKTTYSNWTWDVPIP